MIRSFARPQRQLHAAFSSSLTSYKRGCTAPTNTWILRASTPLAPRNKWINPSLSAQRGLATQATGFEGHKLPSLPHIETYTEHGVEGFLSPEGFDLAWTQYQSMILEKLNIMTVGTADATTIPKNLVEKYGRSSDKASLFNYASMASNNHIFFSCLSPKKTEPSAIFLTDIGESFSSYDTLRTEMIETADAMFGPGFVWIVKDQELGKMKLLCTYLAGSPFPKAHFRSQQIDMATYTTAVPNTQRFMDQREPTNHTGSFGKYSMVGQKIQRAPGNYNGQPILCVNTWEHAYLRDYGVAGKRAYLERWWDRIDWLVVERTARTIGPESVGRSNMGNYMNLSFRKHRAAPTYL